MPVNELRFTPPLSPLSVVINYGQHICLDIIMGNDIAVGSKGVLLINFLKDGKSVFCVFRTLLYIHTIDKCLIKAVESQSVLFS